MRQPTYEEILKIVEESWNKVPKRDIHVATGRGGALNYYELLLGRELTQEEKYKLEDGVYEINNGFIEYKGKFL